MASLPAQHASLSLHLTDRTLTPILSSARDNNPERQAGLDALASTALATYASALRLELGNPVRVMVEFENNGPVVLSSLLDPEAVVPPAPFVNGTQDLERKLDGAPGVQAEGDEEEERMGVSEASHTSSHTIPMLLGVVVAPDGDRAGEARRAASRLERVGRQFQAALAEEQKRERDDLPD